LLGLGLREFSMAPSRVPLVKQQIRTIAMSQAVAFAETIMAKSDEAEIRALLDQGAITPQAVNPRRAKPYGRRITDDRRQTSGSN
jgi:signal transduction protein with GAF and PtsI domain